MENGTNMGNSFIDLNGKNVSLSNDTFSGKGPSSLKFVSNITLTTTLITIMVCMGCTIEFWKLIQHLRRPIGAAIGMLAQFIVLPLVTFGFAHAFQLEPVTAIGMLVMGCCPSGSMSNVYSYWVDGDVPLSLTMTTLATLLALGMMPLNIWLYSRSWTNEDLFIPYKNIIVSLAMTLGPATVGIFLRWKWEKIALVIVKFSQHSSMPEVYHGSSRDLDESLIASICGVIGIILSITFLNLLYPLIYKSSWKNYAGAYLLTSVGFALGYIVAKLFRMNATHARTVAFETGMQNIPLCMTLITLSFPKQMIPKLVRFPVLYGIFAQINSCLLVLLYYIGKRVKAYKIKRTRNDFISLPTSDNPDGVEMSIVVTQKEKVAEL